jgi:hypothetical protein
MKLTRERKIFGGVLVVAVAALAFDQLGGSSSDSSSASNGQDPNSLLMASTAASPSSAASRGNVASAANVADGPSLAQRLAAAAGPAGATPAPDQIRDVFRIPRAWSGNTQVVAVSDDKLAADRFVQAHKLSAVSKNGSSATGDGGVAVVDGKLLHPGAVIEGFKLVAVTRSSAVFGYAQQRGLRLRRRAGRAPTQGRGRHCRAGRGERDGPVRPADNVRRAVGFVVPTCGGNVGSGDCSSPVSS